MSNTLEWAGTCRGKIMEYGIREADSGAIAISVKAAIDAYFDTEGNAWVECGGDNYEATGDLWIVKKDGTPNSGQVESLCQHAGWDGNLESVASSTWATKPCSFVLNREEYKDVVRHRISFLNAYDRTPGLVGNVSSEKAKALQDRFGAQFRALAGNVQWNTVAPAGKPPVPPPVPPPAKKPGPKPAAKPEHVPVSQGIGTGAKPDPQDDSIPFMLLIPWITTATMLATMC